MNTNRFERTLLRPESLLVCYALAEIVWTWLRLQREWGELVRNNSPNASLPSFESPIRVYADILLLLAASVGLWTRKPWGYLIATFASGWLLYRGLVKWQSIVSSVDAAWSSSILTYWLTYAHGWSDFARLILAALILLVATGSLVRRLFNKNSHRAGRILHQNN